jgi:L-lactate dehydrogenase complex protein LldG
MSSREFILDAIRRALSTPAAPERDDPGPSWPARAADGATPVEMFRARFESAGGEWREGIDSLGPLVAGMKRVWSSVEIALPGIEVIRRLDLLEAADSIDATLTDVDAAIAETGSFGFVIRSERGRLSSLVAPVHIALFRREQIVPSLEEWLKILESDRGSWGLLATGPSRSADIEQVLTIGVHGPARVFAVLCD